MSCVVSVPYRVIAFSCISNGAMQRSEPLFSLVSRLVHTDSSEENVQSLRLSGVTTDNPT